MIDQTTTSEQAPDPDQTTIGGCQQEPCSARNEVLDALEEWGQHFLETRNPAGLVVLRAKAMIKDQADRIGEMLAALDSLSTEKERIRHALIKEREWQHAKLTEIKELVAKLNKAV